MAIFKNGILIDPLNEVIEELENNMDNNIILFGCPGTGKSVVLNEFAERPSINRLIVDTSLKYGEFIPFKDEEIYKLYHICLIVQKLIRYVEKNIEEGKLFFALLKNNIKNILNEIILIYNTNKTELKECRIDEKYLKEPEILLESFFELAFKILNYEKITLIIDDFDKVGESSSIYQKYIYEILKNYLNVFVIYTASDKELDRERLSQVNKIVDVNYAFDPEVLKNIFDMQFRREAFLTGIRPSKFFNDEVFEKMINLTNGNLYEMGTALNYFYHSDLKNTEIMFYYIEKILYQDPVISGNLRRARKFHI